MRKKHRTIVVSLLLITTLSLQGAVALAEESTIDSFEVEDYIKSNSEIEVLNTQYSDSIGNKLIKNDDSGNCFISYSDKNVITMIPKEEGHYYGIDMEENKEYIVSGIYGQVGKSIDGELAVESKLNNPMHTTIDSKGNIYFSDYGNNVIKKN